eukprot:TRINITY_DN35804_c0_g1_i1.p1 TRINITY_DN35804_c0_g1~~TRINITY_DN35804_c0_g1_i1.p1  ORF type:complete len:112 (+),score=33.00 TRINITY_DN35804_c0_g1_i1:93-428(+)
MIRRPPRSTQGVSSAASDVYKRQVSTQSTWEGQQLREHLSPLSLSFGFSMYMKKRITELLEDLQTKGKITKEESKRYYEKYIPKDIQKKICLLYTSPSPRDLSTSRMPSSA